MISQPIELIFLWTGVSVVLGVLIGIRIGKSEERYRLRRYVCLENIPGTGDHTVVKGRCVECGQRVP